MDWSDVVFLGLQEVQGKSLSEVLADYASMTDAHDMKGYDTCQCDYCQTFVPMAAKLERLLAGCEAQVEELTERLTEEAYPEDEEF